MHRFGVLGLLALGVWAQAPLTVTPRNLVDGVLGNSYGSVSNGGFVTTGPVPFYGMTGGTPPYSIRVLTGALPPGIGLQGNGRLDGAPSSLGTYNYTIELSDSANRRVQLAGQRITVVPPPSRSFQGNVGNTLRTMTACNTNVGGTFQYSVAGSVPPGMSLNATGGIAGTPTQAGQFQARWNCRLSGGTAEASFTTDFVFVISAPSRVALARGTVGRPFTFTPSGFGGGAGPFTFSIQGAITPGLRLVDAATGRMAGTPTTPGNYSWTLRRLDAAGNARLAEYFQNVVAASGTPLSMAPAVISFEGPAGYISPIVKAFSISGGAPGQRYAVSVGSGASWLSVGQGATGSLPGSGVVMARLGAVPPGSYSGSLVLTATGGTGPADEPVEVPVRLTVGSVEVPELTAGPADVRWEAPNDAPQRDFRLQIANTGGGVASYTVELIRDNTQDRAPWVSSANARAELPPGQAAPLIVTLKPKDIEPGTYSARIVVRYGVNFAETLTIPIRLTVTRVCPVLRFNPDVIRFSARPFTATQDKTARWTWTSEDPKPKWRANYMPGWTQDRDLVKTYEQPMEGEGAGELRFTIEPQTWDEAGASLTNRGGYLDLQWDVKGDCRKRSTLGVSLFMLENPLPEVEPYAVVLPSRSRTAPTESAKITIVPKGIGAFDWSAEVVELRNTSDAGNGTLFFGLNQASGKIGPSEEGTLPPNVELTLEQVPNLPLPGYFSAKILIRFTRPNGEERRAYIPVGQIVGSAALPPPPTPELPPIIVFQSRKEGSKNAEEEVQPDPECRSGVVTVTPFVSSEFAGRVGEAASLQALLINECGAVVKDGSLMAEFTNGDKSVELIPAENGFWSGTWVPRRAEEATVIDFVWEREGSPTARASVGGEVAEGDGRAVVEEGGVIGAASRERAVVVAPGSLLVVRGRNLAKAAAVSAGGAEVLEGVRARTDELQATVLTAGPETVTLRVSNELRVGSVYDLLVRGEGPEAAPVQLAAVSAAPGIYTEDGSGRNQGRVFVVATNGDRTLAAGAAGAVAGSTVAVEMSGLGVVDAEGKVKAAVVALIGSGEVEAKADSAVAVAGRPGVYEVRFKLPAGVPPNQRVPLVVTADGYRSQTVTFSAR